MPFSWALIKKLALSVGRAKVSGIQPLLGTRLKVPLAAGAIKALYNHIGKNTFAAKALTELSVVGLAAPALANQAHYLGRTLGVMSFQPGFKKRSDFMG